MAKLQSGPRVTRIESLVTRRPNQTREGAVGRRSNGMHGAFFTANLVPPLAKMQTRGKAFVKPSRERRPRLSGTPLSPDLRKCGQKRETPLGNGVHGQIAQEPSPAPLA